MRRNKGRVNWFAFGVAVNLAMGIGGLLALVAPARTQPRQSNSIPMFENVTISPEFTPDPLTVRGLSGGMVASEATAGRDDTPTGPCVGFVDEKPDHTIDLTSFFKYLSFRVKSSADTVLVVRGPGGSWCNDDYTDMNPGIAGQLMSGTYEIWVGSYKTNNYHPYVNRITDTPDP
ncbi:MAG: hypothetical protein ACFBSC_04290 [Microcoleaceae cyanobacterium]